MHSATCTCESCARTAPRSISHSHDSIDRGAERAWHSCASRPHTPGIQNSNKPRLLPTAHATSSASQGSPLMWPRNTRHACPAEEITVQCSQTPKHPAEQRNESQPRR
eukprot:jgi/Ulvmu1/2353/UM013_0201.1